MDYSVYVISAKTNMHIGSGDTTFGVIDNKVQRDVLTNFPIIQSSSLKGALREFYKEFLEENNPEIVKYFFGSSPQENDQISGKYRFFDANLLSIPTRSNKNLYYRATTISIVKNYLENVSNFGVEIDDVKPLQKLSRISITTPVTLRENGEIEIEDYRANFITNLNLTPDELNQIEKLLGDKVVLFNEEDFKTIIEDLPVVARNNLVNGESKNLWYEEIVPRETKFYFFVGIGNRYGLEFDSEILNKLVQIGGNASIGYGFSKIVKISK